MHIHEYIHTGKLLRKWEECTSAVLFNVIITVLSGSLADISRGFPVMEAGGKV